MKNLVYLMMAVVLMVSVTLALGLVLAQPSEAQADTIRYVRVGGTGDGTSWATASGTLQAMIDNTGTPCQVWVATGTYTPTSKVGCSGTRCLSFQMKNGVEIYGGFSDSGSPTWEDRDWETYETILSGEIGNSGTKADNCYHVVRCASVGSSTVINGFTIRDGYADGSHPEDSGGGMLISDNSYPVITNCMVRDNSSNADGGGIYGQSMTSLPTISNSSFINNYSNFGGGLYVMDDVDDGKTVSVLDCAFIGNTGNAGAGALLIWGNSEIDRCVFNNNQAIYGGAVGILGGGTPSLVNCIFYDNYASGSGGATILSNTNASIVNCTFYDNTAAFDGGALCYLGSYCNSSVTNTILWGNTPDQIYDEGAQTITYCDIWQSSGTYPGTSNINGTPMFVNPGSGNFHLTKDSPCIDAGTNSAVSNTDYDFEGDDRVMGGTVDMGVDEFYFSMVSFGDSLSDEGSNGKVWVELLAEEHFDDGEFLNMAVGGACTGTGCSCGCVGIIGCCDKPYLVNLNSQIDNYLEEYPVYDDALYTVWAGGNDLLWASYPFIDDDSLCYYEDSDRTEIRSVMRNASGTIVQNIVDAGSQLANAGAKNILIPNIPDLGRIPGGLICCTEVREDGSYIANYLNTLLAEGISTLESAYPDTNFYSLDAYSFLEYIIENPLVFGFDNVTDQLKLAGSTTDTYLWWDELHPTEDGHLLVAKQAYRAIEGAIHVDASAQPGGNGENWDTAYQKLQDGLNAASNWDWIWVASGTYTPGTNRTDSFQMKNNIDIWGGFPNTGTPVWEDRDPAIYETILSGEIGASGTKADNCYHVVTGTDSAILDGFTVSDGYANGSSDEDKCGAGMGNMNCSPTVSNCIFENNYTEYHGAGMANCSSGSQEMCASQIINCRFENNLAFWGGGIFNYSQSGTCMPTIAECIFENNLAAGGGGIHNLGSGSFEAVISDCTFKNNTDAWAGGGMFNGGTGMTYVTNCEFIGNEAHFGGALGAASNTTIVNTIFQNNEGDYGGAIRHSETCDLIVTNCTLYGNTANNSGGGINNIATSIITNCIIWGNESSGTGDNITSNATVTYSCIGGTPTYSGTGNINSNPLFVNPGSGNFHLQSISLCIDSGTNSAPSLLDKDYEGNNRIIDGDSNGTAIADMGADEYQIIFVDDDATGDDDGTTWNDAYTDLQDALDEATSGGQIWVASGTYIPSVLHYVHPYYKSGTRCRAFELVSGVSLYGGFSGTESSINQRQMIDNSPGAPTFANETVLSGDLDPSGNDDGIVNGATWSHENSMAAGMLIFDGKDDYVQIIDAGSDTLPNLQTSEAITIDAWINPGTLTDSNYIFSNGYDSATGEGVFLRLSASGSLQFGIGNSSSDQVVSSSTTIVADEWTHIAATWSSAGSSSMILWINGGSDSSSATFTGTVSFSLSKDILIGRSANNYFSGSIDEFRLYDKVIPHEWINHHYCNIHDNSEYNHDFPDTEGVDCPGLLGYWTFDIIENNKTRDWASGDDSYHVVIGVKDAILDGFTITSGNANNSVFENTWYGYNDVTGGGLITKFPFSISNCIFKYNTATGGGGLYYDPYYTVDGSEMLSISKCSFTKNAVYQNQGPWYDCACIHADGAGIYCSGKDYKATLIIDESCFSENIGRFKGGAIKSAGGVAWNPGGISDVVNLTISNSEFTSNLGLYGAGLYTEAVTNPMTIDNCDFINNHTSVVPPPYGSYPHDPKPADNQHALGGAVFMSTFTSGTLSNCVFTSNSANDLGGAIARIGTAGSTLFAKFINCIFNSNLAHHGGAVVTIGENQMLSNCTFYGNNTYQLDGLINGATTISGIKRLALDFDGSNDYVSIPDDYFFTLDQLSVSLFAKASSGTINSRGLVSKYNIDKEWAFYINDSGSLCFTIHDWQEDYIGKYAKETITNPGTWHHYAVTWNGMTNFDSIELYIDGTLVTNSGTFSGPGEFDSFSSESTVLRDGDSEVWIGSRGLDGTPEDMPWDGILDEVRIYSKALTANQIADLSSLNSISKDMAGFWSFDNLNNGMVTDEASHGSGVLTGGLPGTMMATNCILWNNSGTDIVVSSPGTAVVSYSNIEGDYAGTSNINLNPLFVNAGSDNFHLQATSPCIGAGSNSAAADIDYDFEGDARIIGSTVDMGVDETKYAIYVDGNASGSNNGSSWLDAYTDLQNALDDANLNIGYHIWIASGTYTPGTNRTDTFQMKNGVEIYGGFPSSGSPTWNDRDWDTYETILSGEIGNSGTKADNCYHVVTGTDNAVLDGFTIENGCATGTSDEDKYGAGMGNLNCSPTISNCIFRNNYAESGGAGISNAAVGSQEECLPQIINCQFENNIAFLGGGIFNYSENGTCMPVITDCIFESNQAAGGGGIYNAGVSGTLGATIEDCEFLNNTDAWAGGGMFNDYSSATAYVSNCKFIGNEAHFGGGLQTGNSSDTTVVNSIFWNNDADYGGAIRHSESDLTVTNCTIYGNDGGGILNISPSTITNCIIWGNTANNISGNGTVTYSCIGGTPVYSGIGNINGTPMFVNPGSGDFHLDSQSPCINAGTNSASNLPDYDFEGDGRIIDLTVDMGVDEYKD